MGHLPQLQCLLQVFHRGGYYTLRAYTNWDVVEEGLSQLLSDRLYILLHQVGAQDAHAAVDVEPHSARRHNCLRIVHIEGGHVPDCKAVSRVTIRHRYGRFHDTRQTPDVGNLLDLAGVGGKHQNL